MEPSPGGLSIKRVHPRPAARLRLFCFPWAGQGASAFHRWSGHLPERIEVAALQYPGREDRFREPALKRWQPLVEMLAADVRPYLDRPFAFWGHSMGALLAFELSRTLASSGSEGPRHLFVSGRQAPHLPDPVERIPDLPDAEFARELQTRYGGVPEMILRDPEIRAVFLPTIRADLELVYTYSHQGGAPLRCGISALGGSTDRLSKDQLEAWQMHTVGEFRLDILPGDHFFVTSQTKTILDMVQDDLRRVCPELF